MVGTSVPLHELVGETPPPVVLDLLSGLLAAAVGSGVDQFHPAQIRIGQGARVSLVLVADALDPHPLTTAPELSATGPTQATLVYAAGGAAVLAALPRAAPPPAGRDAHVEWGYDIEARLRAHWLGHPGGDRAAMILSSCLSFDPHARPSVRRLLEDVRSLALPSDEGLVRFTGSCPPALPGELPDRTPAPTPSLREVAPSRPPNRTPSLSATPMATRPQAVRLPPALTFSDPPPPLPVPTPRSAPPRGWPLRVGVGIGLGCALLAGMTAGAAIPRLLLPAPEADEPTPLPEPDRVRAAPPGLAIVPAPPVEAPDAPSPPAPPAAEPAAPGETVATPPAAEGEPAAEDDADADPTAEPPRKRPRRRLFGPRD